MTDIMDNQQRQRQKQQQQQQSQNQEEDKRQEEEEEPSKSQGTQDTTEEDKVCSTTSVEEKPPSPPERTVSEEVVVSKPPEPEPQAPIPPKEGEEKEDKPPEDPAKVSVIMAKSAVSKESTVDRGGGGGSSCSSRHHHHQHNHHHGHGHTTSRLVRDRDALQMEKLHISKKAEASPPHHHHASSSMDMDTDMTEREAAEVLLQMGVGRMFPSPPPPQRKSVIIANPEKSSKARDTGSSSPLNLSGHDLSTTAPITLSYPDKRRMVTKSNKYSEPFNPTNHAPSLVMESLPRSSAEKMDECIDLTTSPSSARRGIESGERRAFQQSSANRAMLNLSASIERGIGEYVPSGAPMFRSDPKMKNVPSAGAELRMRKELTSMEPLMYNSSASVIRNINLSGGRTNVMKPMGAYVQDVGGASSFSGGANNYFRQEDTEQFRQILGPPSKTVLPGGAFILPTLTSLSPHVPISQSSIYPSSGGHVSHSLSPSFIRLRPQGDMSSTAVGSNTNLAGLCFPPGATLIQLPMQLQSSTSSASGHSSGPPSQFNPLLANSMPGALKDENNKSIYLPHGAQGDGLKLQLLDKKAREEEKRAKKAARAAICVTLNGEEGSVMFMEVDGHKIPKDAWAKAFMQTDICHAAGILFKALFTTKEIQNCTLRGRNGTNLLDMPKRAAIFKAVGWMKFKERDPYSFVCAKVEEVDQLSQEEKNLIEKKVFVERRYQTSRKIRDSPRNKARAIAPSSSSFLQPHHQTSHSHSLFVVEEAHSSSSINMTGEKPEELIVKPEPMDAEYYEADYSPMGEGVSSSSSQHNMPDYSSFVKTELTEERGHELDQGQGPSTTGVEVDGSFPSAKQRKMNEPFGHSEK